MSGFDYKTIKIDTPKMDGYSNNKSNFSSKDLDSISFDTEILDLEDNGEDEPKTDFASNIVKVDGYYRLDVDYDEIIATFGGQYDDLGNYDYDKSGCDNYSRGFCLYIQTGEIPDYLTICNGTDELDAVCVELDNRKKQAQIAFDILSSGKPCIIHVNSPSGRGHWVCVVGVKEGVDRDSVTIGDFLILDPSGNKSRDNNDEATCKLMPASDEPVFLTEGLDKCSVGPGYQIYFYD